MYPILILRSELVCLVILVFLLFTSRAYHVNNESRAFGRILRFALIHVVFDAVTVLTVNHVDTVPVWLNWICHVIFYLSAIFFSCEIVNYVIAICYPRQARRLYSITHILATLYICCLPFLKIEYVPDVGTYSSAGSASIVGYGLAFSFFIAALVLIFTHMRMMTVSLKNALIPMMLVLIITEVSQVIWRSVLFTGGAVTIVTVGFFFSLENPVAVFRKKAMIDALTGVRSRSSYEEDIEKYNKRFIKNPGDEYTIVFCDINDLRSINNRYGHTEGDNYITLIASAIIQCMKHSAAVYRIGGDEFLVIYYQISTDTVEKELNSLHATCAKISEKLNYTATISAGYAKSSPSYKSLRDVIKTADYAMYRNKSENRRDNSSYGTDLNYAGLTDKIFDVMCASNDRSYPFIMNLDTHVTRIAPGWKDFFGLETEFFADFNAVWKYRIHPDYYESYMEDIGAVMNGHRKYHNFDYLAKKADGEYVRVSCHGSVYQDKSDGTSYFAGFMNNHGMDDNIDPVSGLRNFDALTSCVCRHLDEEKPFSVMKLKLNNFARVNMLYGYSGGNELIRSIVSILNRELNGMGEVFCQNAVNLSILFEICDQKTIENYYRRISEICSAGLQIERGTVPLLLSGGAFTSSGKRIEIDQMRACLVFALEESQYYQRNNLIFYHDIEDSSHRTDISLLSEIHADALSDMTFFQLRYQPIVDIASGKTVGAEALLRWIHPIYGEIPPSKFIAFIEYDPCYYRLGLGILEHSIMDAKRIQQMIPDFRVNVNITALQLQNENFIDHVFEILEKYDYAPDKLVLELTERCKEMDCQFLAKKIAELRSRGLLVAFDDLGTGYSSFNLLMDIPVDEIKLDKDFVKGIEHSKNYQVFVRTLILGSASHGNNYLICFEGIENEDMLHLVSLFGNFLVQGYYFTKPLLIDDFVEYLANENGKSSV